MDVNDSVNITGISSLLNYNGSEKLADLEKSIINDEEYEEENGDVDIVESYKKKLGAISSALGLDSDEEDEDDEDGGDGGDEDVDGGDEDVDGNENIQPYKESIGFANKYDSQQIDTMYNNSIQFKPNSYGARITEEQKKQRILSSVLSDVKDHKFNVEKEKEEDDKAIMLEQIDMLMTNLKDEGINLSRIPQVTNQSNTDDIKSVHKILRLKNDRNRYCSFAEECVLAVAHILEWLFDGKKTYMGRSPDLRGWHSTVNMKLRRMKYDTSTFVSGIMQDYDMGSGVRMALELIPSLFLYSKMKKSQGSDNLITSDEMNSAIDRIRDIEESSHELE
jgi:hypothetical protein